MASVNKVILLGNLGNDPEKRVFGNGDSVCNFSLATTETWKDRATGEKRSKTEWHNIVLYRGLADVAKQYLKKGSQVYLEGKLQTRKWQDKNGQDRYTTEIICDAMQMLGSRSSERFGEGDAFSGGQHFNAAPSYPSSNKPFEAPDEFHEPPSAPRRQTVSAPLQNLDDMDDDIPF